VLCTVSVRTGDVVSGQVRYLHQALGPPTAPRYAAVLPTHVAQTWHYIDISSQGHPYGGMLQIRRGGDVIDLPCGMPEWIFSDGFENGTTGAWQ
jgi:hypothetical protein